LSWWAIGQPGKIGATDEYMVYVPQIEIGYRGGGYFEGDAGTQRSDVGGWFVCLCIYGKCWALNRW
jgi:hypothetical protein